MPPCFVTRSLSCVEMELRKAATRRKKAAGIRQLFLFTNILKPWPLITVPVYGFCPHGGRPHPQTLLTIKSAVNNQFLHRLRMMGNSNHFVMIPLEMTIFSRFYFHKCSSKEKRRGLLPGVCHISRWECCRGWSVPEPRWDQTFLRTCWTCAAYFRR